MSVETEAARERTRAVWSSGDYDQIARRITLEPGVEMLTALAPQPGERLLDVAAGTGNVALRAAEMGCTVTASDLTPTLLEHGRAHAESQGLQLEWDVADAEELPYPDASFDVVTSAFGAMFAPHPERAASEMFRVLRPGGRFGMVNWVPDGVMGQVFAVGARYLPPPPGAARPSEWGDQATATARLQPHASHLSFERRTTTFCFASVDQMAQFMHDNAPPQVAARALLDPADADAEAFGADCHAVYERNARAVEQGIAIDAEYLLITAVR